MVWKFGWEIWHIGTAALCRGWLNLVGKFAVIKSLISQDASILSGILVVGNLWILRAKIWREICHFCGKFSRGCFVFWLAKFAQICAVILWWSCCVCKKFGAEIWRLARRLWLLDSLARNLAVKISAIWRRNLVAITRLFEEKFVAVAKYLATKF